MAGENEKRYQDMPFGFESEESFALAVNTYIQSVRDDINGDWSWVDELPRSKKKRALQFKESKERELEVLEDRFHEMSLLYALVQNMYAESIRLEQEGKSRKEIADYFIDEKEEEVGSLSRLLEHGLGTSWGYHFTQTFLAFRASKEYEQSQSED